MADIVAMEESTPLPLIDISLFDADYLQKQEIARQGGRAFERVGFASFIDHRVPESLLSGVYDEGRHFFDLPLQLKMPCYDDVKIGGYSPIGIEAVGRSRGSAAATDLCEALPFMNLHVGVTQVDPAAFLFLASH